MTDWIKFLSLSPKEYNCWTFIEKIQTDVKVWNPELQNLYDTKKHKWGEHITFKDIEKLAENNYGIKIELKDLQPHDILMFGVNDVRPLHFGLYIGKNQFIHLRKIPKIDDLDDYWRARLKLIYREEK
jgi:O-phosphoseryl-tRNA(Cys) synthetase